MRGLHELLTARFFTIDPTAAAGYRKVLEKNMNGRIPFSGADKLIGKKVSAVSGDVIEATRISTESGMEVSKYNNNQDDPFINVLIIDGPMTRMGDACSYGSIDHRDMIISAANNQNCVGHLFIVNTPGGTEWTHNDYQQAIDYAHSKQQPVLMWIDGDCMSAGMYLASMCDEIYYMHPKDQVGCIGVMGMFYTMKNGEKDFSGETYHEIYDPESFNKNQDIREIAEDGNDKLFVAELAELGKEFRAAITKRFPKAKDEMIHGNIYYAEKVKGIFLDGQTDLGGAFDRTIKLAKKMGNNAAVNVSAINQNNKNMSKQYQNIATLLGTEELAVKTNAEQVIENGSFLNLEQLDKMEKQIGELKAKAEKTEAKEADCKKVQEERDALANEKIQRQAQIEELQKQNAQLKTDNENAAKAGNDRITELEHRITELEQCVKDKDAQIEELSKDPGNEPEAGAAPANNGTGAQETEIVATVPVYDKNKSYVENMAVINEFNKTHGK